MSTIIIISNGFGEDLIGSKLALSLKAYRPKSTIHAISLVGPGTAYKAVNINVVHSAPIPPSGGFIRSLKDLFMDLNHGLISQYFKSYRIIKSQIEKADIVICVGDTFCLAMGSAKKHNNRYFLPTAKSDRFMPHSWLEYWYIKRKAKRTFPRDKETQQSFAKRNIPSAYLGFPMFDLTIDTHPPFLFETTQPITGILPGSRIEAYSNLKKILSVICHPHYLSNAFVLSCSPSLDHDKIATVLAAEGWTQTAPSQWQLNNTKQLIITTKFEQVIQYCPLIIGLAGTANEQACHFGCSVYSFPGSGPQSTPKRLQEQVKLMNNAITFIPTDHPEKIVSIINSSFANAPTPTQQTSSPAAPAIIENILHHNG